MKSKWLVPVLVSSLIGLTACGNDSTSGSSASGSLGGAYQGRWKAGCEILAANSSRQLTVSINGDGSLQMQFAVHANTTCSLLASTEVASGSYLLGGANINAKDANDISFELKSSAFTLETVAVAAFNSGSVCGTNTWAAGVPKIFPLPNNCSSATLVKGSTLVGLVNGHLYFGNSTSTALNMTEPFTKQ